MSTGPGVEAIQSTGDLSATKPDAVLQVCEALHFTGTLTFTAADVRGVLPMLNGMPELDDGAGIEEALEQFLALREGRYVLTQMLPPLEGADAEGMLAMHGTLQPATVADLMRYCEGLGLSGEMTVRDEAGRACIARYDRGELNALEIDEQSGADFAELFSWVRGTFRIRADAVFRTQPTPPPAPRESLASKGNLLRSLEVALTEILATGADRSARLRAISAAPSIRPPSMLRGTTLPFGVQGARTITSDVSDALATWSGKYRARKSALPPSHAPDATVKVQFVAREMPTRDSGLHKAAKLGAEEIPWMESSSPAALSPPATAKLSGAAPLVSPGADLSRPSVTSPLPLISSRRQGAAQIDSVMHAPSPEQPRQSAPADEAGPVRAMRAAAAIDVVAASEQSGGARVAQHELARESVVLTQAQPKRTMSVVFVALLVVTLVAAAGMLMVLLR